MHFTPILRMISIQEDNYQMEDINDKHHVKICRIRISQNRVDLYVHTISIKITIKGKILDTQDKPTTIQVKL